MNSLLRFSNQLPGDQSASAGINKKNDITLAQDLRFGVKVGAAKPGALKGARIADVLAWQYTGNKLHPTEKPFSVLIPLVEVFSKPGDVVLDAFCGSGSSLVAAKRIGRSFIGIEIDAAHAELARSRIGKPVEAAA